MAAIHDFIIERVKIDKIKEDCLREEYGLSDSHIIEKSELAGFDVEDCVNEAISDSIFDITILDFISNIGDAPALMLLVPVAMFVLFLYMRRK